MEIPHLKIPQKNTMLLQKLLTIYRDAVWKETRKGKSPEEILKDVKLALSEYKKEYQGMDEKLERDIHFVYQQAVDSIKNEK